MIRDPRRGKLAAVTTGPTHRAAGFLAALLTFASVAAADPLPAVRADGTRWVTRDGGPIVLRGVNLGNWLILERWMFRFDKGQWEDQAGLEALLADRFGVAAKDRLLDVHREHWIIDRDLELAKSFGFNAVRVPFHYGLLVDEADPGGPLRADAFRWLDRAVDLAERHGLYVVLDMHSAPGGQSDAHHAWRGGQNAFWGDPANWRHAARLWGEIASRYRDRPNVAAYDLLNEPYGVAGDRAADLLPRATRPMVEAVRAAGSEQIVLLSGTAAMELDFYDPPADLGWDNVGFTLHEYPGRYGHERTRENVLGWFDWAHPRVAAQVDRLGGPFLMGEHNTNFREPGLDGADLQSRQFASHAARGFASTLWCLKLLRNDDGEWSSFALATNARPVARPDLRTATYDEIADYFRRVGAMEYEVDETLRRRLQTDFGGDPATRPAV